VQNETGEGSLTRISINDLAKAANLRKCPQDALRCSQCVRNERFCQYPPPTSRQTVQPKNEQFSPSLPMILLPEKGVVHRNDKRLHHHFLTAGRAFFPGQFNSRWFTELPSQAEQVI